MPAFDPKRISKAWWSGGQEDLFFHIGLTWRRTFMTRCAGLTFRDLGCCQRAGYRQRVHCERHKKYDYAADNRSHNPCFRCRLHIIALHKVTHFLQTLSLSATAQGTPYNQRLHCGGVKHGGLKWRAQTAASYVDRILRGDKPAICLYRHRLGSRQP